MTGLIYTLILIIVGLIIGLAYAIYNVIGYRNLTVKLTETIKEMYCKEEGCEYLRYYSTPIDNKAGVMTDYCSIHLMKHVGPKDGQP